MTQARAGANVGASVGLRNLGNLCEISLRYDVTELFI